MRVCVEHNNGHLDGGHTQTVACAPSSKANGADGRTNRVVAGPTVHVTDLSPALA